MVMGGEGKTIGAKCELIAVIAIGCQYCALASNNGGIKPVTAWLNAADNRQSDAA